MFVGFEKLQLSLFFPQMFQPETQLDRYADTGESITFCQWRSDEEITTECVDQAKEPGAKIGAWNANGGPNQLWGFEPATGGGVAATPYGQQQYQFSQHQQHGGAGTAHRLV